MTRTSQFFTTNLLIGFNTPTNPYLNQATTKKKKKYLPIFCYPFHPPPDENKRLQVAYTHAHAHMRDPVPQGSRWFSWVLYIYNVTISYVTRVVAVCRDESVTLFRTGSLVTGNAFPSPWKIEAKICSHKFACTKGKRKKRKTEPKP